ncbi:hypothetical protein JHK87_011582 [Glycine soja]|nr:hypothetical protein JHK87_011582 [Glycine soja]
MGVKRNLVEWTPFIAMATVECLDVELSTLSKAAMSRGMNHFVLVGYSNALATLILLPSPFFIDTQRKLLVLIRLFVVSRNHKTRPSLSFSLLCKFFLLGILGLTVMQNCVFTAIDYSSATLGSTTSNLSPEISFVLAVTPSSISQIKVMGAVLSISGALVVTLYKGSFIITFRIQPSLLDETSNWVIGGLVFAIASVSFAAWNITQAVILKEYSSQSTIIAYYCLFGTIQSEILSLFVVRDSNAWKISPNDKLICIFYSAIAGSVVTFSVTAWCIKRKGPVFVSMFKPAGIAIAAFSSVVFLCETLHFGSNLFQQSSSQISNCLLNRVLVIIAIGLYTLLWAQSKEENAEDLQVDRKSSPSAQASPLLESHQRNVLA